MEPDRTRASVADDDDDDDARSSSSSSASTNKSNSGTVNPQQSVLTAAEEQDRRIRQLEEELAAANHKNRRLVQQKDDQLAEQNASFMSKLEFLLWAFDVPDHYGRDEIRSSLLLAGFGNDNDDDGEGEELEKAVFTLQLVMNGFEQRILDPNLDALWQLNPTWTRVVYQLGLQWHLLGWDSVPWPLQNDLEFGRSVVAVAPNEVFETFPELRNDRAVWEAVIAENDLVDHEIFSLFAPADSILVDRPLMEQAVRNNCKVLSFVQEPLATNFEFVSACIDDNITCLEPLSPPPFSTAFPTMSSRN
jgi:hypothetical protein